MTILELAPGVRAPAPPARWLRGLVAMAFTMAFTTATVAPAAWAQAAPPPPPARGGPPPDSVLRPAAIPNMVPPANAVAQCNDGAFVIAPNDTTACASHRGVRVRMPPSSATPPKPVAPGEAAVMSAPTRTIAPADPAPPPGATMRCKDGTYLTGAPSAVRCADRGGVAALLPVPKPAPAAPRRP